MITTPTVFVFGAGVSMPYGFPSGRQLVEHICEATRPRATFLPSSPDDSRYLISREDIQKILIDQFGKAVTENFGNALYLSHQYSIDAFLEHRVEFMEIGKLAIALFILRKEMEADLVSFENRNKGCYQYLFNKLNTSWNDFTQNRVTFVTFNYDRSLEQFLFTSLQNTYNKQVQECADQINKIPVIHVHGSLGKLLWQDKNGIPYGTLDEYSLLNRVKFNLDLAHKAAKQIKIITESLSDSEEFQSAFKLLTEAERIYFLGFGYHPINIQRLQLGNLPKITNLQRTYIDKSVCLKHSHLIGSAMGMEDAEILQIQNKWLVQLPDNVYDSLRFLRKHAFLD